MNFVSKFTKNMLPKITARTKKAFQAENLIYTNVTLSAGLSGMGDIIEQQLEKITGTIKQYHLKRTINMSISGVALGAVAHLWYKYLDRKIKGNNLRTVFKKVVVDQAIGSPLGISVFFVTMAVLEESSVEELIDEFRHKAAKLYAAEMIVWPPAQFINFYFLPGKYRVLYDNLVSLLTDIYFSFVKHSDKPEESF